MNLHKIILLKKIVKNIIPRWILIQKFPKNFNTILFTFDDGPNPKYSPRILDILDKHRLRACFFCVGKYARLHPELLREISDRGHLIGNHTYNHKNDNYTTYTEIYNDIRKCNDTLSAILNKRTGLFRPPRGKITLTNIYAANKLGLKTILWSVGGEEWSRNANQPFDYIANHILTSIKHNDILLLHDNHPNTIDVLAKICPILSKYNYDFDSGFNLIAKYNLRANIADIVV
jgi:peptidoglycan/xylan/chitin deacetylase (PgdA/CDA1 family)